MTLTHLSLFSGIGGIDLAAERAGFESVGQCEMNKYAIKVLQKNFGDIPRWRDVRDVTKESVWKECQTHKITLLSGGFPCQPFSVAGKQRGKNDDRYLWPEMFRVVRELRPSWVLGENVAGFINMGLDTALSDLESAGYQTRAFILPACGVDASHKRERCFIVAHCNSKSGHETNQADGTIGSERDAWNNAYCGSLRRGAGEPCEDVANTYCNGRDCGIDNCENRSIQSPEEWGNEEDNKERCERINRIRADGSIFPSTDSTQCEGRKLSIRNTEKHTNTGGRGWWETEPAVGRVVDGFPGRVDRLRCLGNAVVPQQVYPILKCIAEIEGGTQDKRL